MAVIASTISSAQAIKTYKGRMSKSPVERVDFGLNLHMSLSPEIWSYQYYEDEEENRIYHGPLTYNFEYGKNAYYTIKGQYSHGKKNGQWEYKAVNGSNKLRGRLVANYKDDLLDGPFEYQDYADVIYDIRKMTGTFSNGELQGELKCSMNGKYSSKSVVAYFSNGGYPDGTWKIDDKSAIDKNTIIRFVNNFLVFQSVVDQSTGERKITKADDITIQDYDLSNKTVLIPEGIAKVLSLNGKRTFKSKEGNYKLGNYDSPTGLQMALGNETSFDEVFDMLEIMHYKPKILTIDVDRERNAADRDSLEEVRIQQEKQARLAEETAREQKRIEAQLAKGRIESQLKDLELKIDKTIALRKNAQKWGKLNATFRCVSKDQPNDKNWVLQFYTCVYRILNSEIDKNSRESYEQKISSEATKARGAIYHAGGWMCYCDYKKLLNDCIELSKGLNLIDMNSIPEFSDEENAKYLKILQKRQKYGF